jgi:hypothetical protein
MLEPREFQLVLAFRRLSELNQELFYETIVECAAQDQAEIAASRPALSASPLRLVVSNDAIPSPLLGSFAEKC